MRYRSSPKSQRVPQEKFRGRIAGTLGRDGGLQVSMRTEARPSWVHALGETSTRSTRVVSVQPPYTKVVPPRPDGRKITWRPAGLPQADGQLGVIRIYTSGFPPCRNAQGNVMQGQPGEIARVPGADQGMVEADSRQSSRPTRRSERAGASGEGRGPSAFHGPVPQRGEGQGEGKRRAASCRGAPSSRTFRPRRKGSGRRIRQAALTPRAANERPQTGPALP